MNEFGDSEPLVLGPARGVSASRRCTAAPHRRRRQHRQRLSGRERNGCSCMTRRSAATVPFAEHVAGRVRRGGPVFPRILRAVLEADAAGTVGPDTKAQGQSRPNQQNELFLVQRQSSGAEYHQGKVSRHVGCVFACLSLEQLRNIIHRNRFIVPHAGAGLCDGLDGREGDHVDKLTWPPAAQA